ncbi:PRC-barrel domain-containing protein [Mariluticola halotolerans]|uniref:PRC-barrel domain-containing protein n=1 Tax=Mariluticola halotolerans TaxID=2909283 RepID=UPI0026E2957D|nr:PRC-barrel domain-containing protein [Mariluticola halotolerans]UJQ96131.1 PRC-barrel domain-containing protein [Mariluticola halotolerans]
MPTTSGHTTAIKASRAIGTKVKNQSGDTVGQVEDLVLDKTDNTIMFAVVGFGGVFGLGEKYHPIPWASLDYSDEEDAYLVPFTKDQLADAPCDSVEELTKNDGLAARESAYDYYRVSPYWM